MGAEIKMPDEFLEKLSRLGSRTDEVTEKVLEAGGKVMLAQVRSNLAGVVGRGTKYPSRSSGQLLGSLGLSPVKQGKDGNHNIKVGFAEGRSDGQSNAKLANILEYGKHGQPAKPFLAPAKKAGKQATIEAMKAKLEEEVGKG